MSEAQSIVVFCGSRPGTDPRAMEAARSVGRAIARHGAGLVYGGARIGLMGATADAALREGGRVVGVIPKGLQKREVAHEGLGEGLEVVPDMHTRKRRMSDLGDAFLVLPGGIGTLEEAIEMLTWRALGLHAKPLMFLDLDGFWSQLFELLQQMEHAGFLVAKHRAYALFETDPEQIVPRLLAACQADPT